MKPIGILNRMPLRRDLFLRLARSFRFPAESASSKAEQFRTNPKRWPRRKQNFANRLKEDPEIKCYMGGVPRSTYLPYPFQIIQGKDTIMIAYEFAGAVRIVNMGKPTEAPTDSWMGWSNGRWEGETLVIDVTGLNDQTWFDRAGNYHSDSLARRRTLHRPQR